MPSRWDRLGRVCGVPGTLYAGTDYGGVFKSTTGGTTWAASNNGVGQFVVTALAMAPSAPGTLYAGQAAFGVCRTTDGAASWTLRSAGLEGVTLNALAIDPSQASTVYAATNAGVFKTTNGGGGAP